jgi:GNAT superfamily N-acetyltransferase
MMSVPDVRIEIGDAEGAATNIDQICEVYDEVFSQPPFHWQEDDSASHRERLMRLMQDPSFGIATASSSHRLIGFAYGYTLPTTTKLWDSLVEPIDPAMTDEWPGRTFLFFDFAVTSPSRGQGIGRRLHDGLLGGRREERAMLTVQPAGRETQAIYRHWGWSQVGRLKAGQPVFDVYLRPLAKA